MAEPGGQRIGEVVPEPSGAVIRNVASLPPWHRLINPVRVSGSKIGNANSDPAHRALNKSARSVSERTLTTAKVNDLIPAIIGRDKVGASIARPINYNNELLLLCVWGMGECDAIEQVEAAGKPIIPIANYLGTATQTGDPTIAAAYSQADDLKGICYSVLSLDPDTDVDVQAIIRGFKLYDPRNATTSWSNNPALGLAHIVDQYSDWGVDWNSIGIAADYCDELVNGKPRWTLDITMAKQMDIDDWIISLAKYANCFVVIENGSVKLVPDAPRATDHVLTGSDIVANSMRIEKLGMRDIPTQARVLHTIIDDQVYIDTETETDDPPSGSPLRIEEMRMPGFHTKAPAKRKAIEALNKANLTDLEVQFVIFDEGLRVTRGDVLDVSHPLGLTNKLLRCKEVQQVEIGRWAIKCREYDPSVYSNAVVSEPTFADTDLPDPNDIPAGPTPTSVTEVLFTDETGRTYTRFEIKFDGSTFPFVQGYRVKVANGTDIIYENTISNQGVGLEHIVPTGATSQGILYTVEVWILNSFGVIGTTAGFATQTGDGKTVPPSDVTGFEAIEAGQFVTFNWNAAVDTDLRGYEVRRLTDTLYEADPSAGWAHASAVVIAERVDLTVFVKPAEPVGVFYYMIKAKDKSGNESVNHAADRVEVTSDYGGAIAIQDLFEDNVNTMPYSRDAAQQAVGQWDYFPASQATTTFDQVGLLGAANTATRITDTSAVANQWLGGKKTDPARPKTHTVVGWFLKENTTATSDFGIELWDNVDPGYDWCMVEIDLNDGSYTPYDKGENNNYKQGVKLVNIGGIDWWRVTLSMENIFDNDVFPFWISARSVANETGAITMANLERYPNVPFEIIAAESAPRINETASIPSSLLVNMHVYELHGALGGRFAVTSGGETFADKFSPGQPFDAVYGAGDRWGAHENVASSLESAEWDSLADRNGNWVWSSAIEVFGGTIVYTASIALEADYPSFISFGGQSINASARFFKAKAELSAGLGNGFRMRIPIQATSQGRILKQTIDSVLTTTQPLAVVFPQAYAAIPDDVDPRYQGGNNFRAVADAVTKTGFDLYLWEADTGVKVAGNVRSVCIGT